MGTSGEKFACPACGGTSAEVRDQGVFCRQCGPAGGEASAVHHGRAVHHEGFPHVVSDEPEP